MNQPKHNIDLIKKFATENNIALSAKFIHNFKILESIIIFENNKPFFIKAPKKSFFSKDSKKDEPRSIFNNVMYELVNNHSKKLFFKVVEIFKIDELIESDSDSKLLFWLPCIHLKHTNRFSYVTL